jgi:hypothetical protein
MSHLKFGSFLVIATITALASIEALNVEIMEYEVPTHNSRPHDPAVAPDGSLWYTGQIPNTKLLVGRATAKRTTPSLRNCGRATSETFYARWLTRADDTADNSYGCLFVCVPATGFNINCC